MIDKILAVQNCGPSGTLLMQSLFDGHPEILALPALHGQQLLIFWERNHTLSLNELHTAFIDAHRYWFQPETIFHDFGLMDMGQNRNEAACVDQTTFSNFLLKAWHAHSTLTRKQFLISIYTAYNQALGRDITQCRYLLYPIHSLPRKYALQLIADFSEVKFLHMIREPIQSMGSLAKHITKNKDWNKHPLLSCVSAQLLNDFTIHAGPHKAYGFTPYLSDTSDGRIQSRAVKLEDIHQQPEPTLRIICNWLNIQWNTVLLRSTFDDKLWHNRAESTRQSGIGSQTISQKHNDIISSFDLFRFNHIAKHFMRAYHYPYPISSIDRVLNLIMPLLIWLPFKMEIGMKRRITPWQYISCRLRWLVPAWKKACMRKQQIFVPLLEKI